MEPKNDAQLKLTDYFNNPVSQRDKQYEAIRAIVIGNAPINRVAEKYGYKPSTIYAMPRRVGSAYSPQSVKALTHSDLQDRIISLRKQDLSAPDIYQRLLEEGIKSAISTIQRILKVAGFAKLPRRTDKELGKSTTRKVIPERLNPSM